MLDEIAAYLRFAWGLREFLRTPITLEYSRQLIRERLQSRENNLLRLVHRAVYENRSSPYLALLKQAGCEYGDFEQMVRSEGIEATLMKLRRDGVYISIDEFKGKKPVKRGSAKYFFSETDFDNPYTTRHLTVSTSGSHGVGIRVYYDLDFLEGDRSVYLINLLHGWNVLGVPRIIWSAILPGPALLEILSCAKAGQPYARWYSPIRSNKFRPSLKNRLGTASIVYAARLYGVDFPKPEYVTMDESWKIVESVSNAIRNHGGCFINANPSRAMALCKAAKAKGVKMQGVKFLLGAEPMTAGKRKEIESAGADVLPKYVFTEGGYVGFGCFAPEFADDIHFFKDSLALIQHEPDSSTLSQPVHAFLFTSLLLSTPKVLLNVENGDYGVLTTRRCGCYFEQLGFTEHIHTIRSFQKLTGQGMTLFTIDLVRLVEEVLPGKFGGTSVDYQILEEEDKDSRTYMTIVVRPDLGGVDEGAIIGAVLAELRKGNDAYRMAAEVWFQTNTIRVKRMNPVTTPGAKLLPVFTLKKK